MTTTEAAGERDRLLHRDLTQAIIGAFYAVHSQLGHGFLEAVYANAMAVVLRGAECGVEREVPFDVAFRGATIGRYRADIVVDSKVIVEVKASAALTDIHAKQLRNYLKASGLQVGLVFNFGPKPDFKRVILL